MDYKNCQYIDKEHAQNICFDGKPRICFTLTGKSIDELRSIIPDDVFIGGDNVELDITDDGNLLVYGLTYNAKTETTDVELQYDGTNNNLLAIAANSMLFNSPVGMHNIPYRLSSIPEVVKYLICNN